MCQGACQCALVYISGHARVSVDGLLTSLSASACTTRTQDLGITLLLHFMHANILGIWPSGGTCEKGEGRGLPLTQCHCEHACVCVRVCALPDLQGWTVH